MSIHQIVTPLDSAVLETKEQYVVYFKIITHAFKELIESITQHDICTEQEVTFMRQYCELLLYSLEAFRVKYLYDDEEKMKIDLTESGFPNHLINSLNIRRQPESGIPISRERSCVEKRAYQQSSQSRRSKS